MVDNSYKSILSNLCGMNQHYRLYDYEAYLCHMEYLGIRNLEMWAGSPHFFLDYRTFSDTAPFIALAKEHNLHYSIFCSPSMLWQYHYGIDGKEHIRRTIEYYKNGVRAAAELGCKIISTNAGWGYANENRRDCMLRSAEAVHEVATFASQCGVFLALETLQPFESNIVNSLQDAIEYYKMVDHPDLKILIDIVAISVAGETVQQWFDAFGDLIVHCHLADGTPSGHMTLGEGNLPIDSIIQNIILSKCYNGLYTLELSDEVDPFSADEKSLKWLEKSIDLTGINE